MRGAGASDGAPKALLARALYDNHPDCADELAFRKGDILTVLEQHVPESEGWWKCLLHGRLGLAPANRLQLLPRTPAHLARAPSAKGLEDAPASPEKAYQVPAPPGPVYEHMKSWVKEPPSAAAPVYEVPNLPASASASIVCEKAPGTPRQVLVSIPRPAWASTPALPTQVYDVPAPSRAPPALKDTETQRLYDIPASPQKASFVTPAGHTGGQGGPPTSAAALRRGGYNTLPNPQKSEWTYDAPPSPGDKAAARNAPLSRSPGPVRPRAAPGLASSLHSPPRSGAHGLEPQLPRNASMQKKLSLPDIPTYDRPAAQDPAGAEQPVHYRVPRGFLAPRVEQQNTRPNVYDIPTAAAAPPARGEPARARGSSGHPQGPAPSGASGRATRLSPELDRLSASSSDSGASVESSSSSLSSDSASSCFSEPAGAPPRDADAARETVAALQRKVAGSVADLMVFVSRDWRSRESLEAHLGSIRRAVELTEGSLRRFLHFAQAVGRTAQQLADGGLQARLQQQLQLLAHSHVILLEAKVSLELLGWSLDALVAPKGQAGPDDLDRFVMAARLLPDDSKRFASIVIANGRLLFKPDSGLDGAGPPAPRAEVPLAQGARPPPGEPASPPTSSPPSRPRESGLRPEPLGNSTDGHEQSPGRLPPQPAGLQPPEKRIHLSEHCRLYFGALFKAISVLSSSLSHSEPPETFITQSKLVIVVGQKLVDALCQETQDRDARNELLCGSNRLCGLLKSLALATKQAVLQYPSPAALDHLQAEAQRLEQHTLQFRGMLQ